MAACCVGLMRDNGGVNFQVYILAVYVAMRPDNAEQGQHAGRVRLAPFAKAPEGWRQAELAAHVRRTRSAPLGKPDSRKLKARSAASPEGEPLAPPQSMQVWIQRVRIQRLMSLDPEGPRQAQVGPEGLAQA